MSLLEGVFYLNDPRRVQPKLKAVSEITPPGDPKN
jgi:hypothetical protein